jgi:hypothetical protein
VKGTLRAAIVGTALLAGSLSGADSPPTAVLSVRISQLRSNDGQVGCKYDFPVAALDNARTVGGGRARRP